MVAARLTETDASVLLLEAGGSAPPETAVPFLSIFGAGGELDWRIRGKPQLKTHFGYTNNVRTILFSFFLNLAKRVFITRGNAIPWVRLRYISKNDALFFYIKSVIIYLDASYPGCIQHIRSFVILLY